MEISIRGHILENFKNDSIEQIREAVEQSVSATDEEVLPGLGVFFSLLWNEAGEDVKGQIISLVKNGISKAS